MAVRLYAVYENEISECILYCIQGIFESSDLYTFLTSEFDVIPIADPVTDGRTPFTLSVTISDDGKLKPETSQLLGPQRDNDPHFVDCLKRVQDACKVSTLGKLLGKGTKLGEGTTVYLEVLQKLYSPIAPLKSLIESKNFGALFLPFFYLAHGITLQSPRENILFLPTTELNGLIGVTLSESISAQAESDSISDLSDDFDQSGVFVF